MGCTQSSGSYTLPRSEDAPIRRESLFPIDDGFDGYYRRYERPSMETLGPQPMSLTEVYDVASAQEKQKEGICVNGVGKYFAFTRTNGDQINIKEFLGEFAATYSIPMAFVRNLRKNEALRQFSLRSLWELGQFDKVQKKYLEANVAQCVQREDMYDAYEKFLRMYSGSPFKSNEDKGSALKAMIPTNLHAHLMHVFSGHGQNDSIYYTTTVGAISDHTRLKSSRGLASMLSDKLGGDPLEVERNFVQLNAIRIACIDVLDMLDLVRHHIRRAVTEENVFLLGQTVEELISSIQNMTTRCTDLSEDEDIDDEIETSLCHSQLQGAFGHLYHRLDSLLRCHFHPLSEIKFSVASLEASVGRMLRRSQHYVRILSELECSVLSTQVNNVIIRRDAVLSQAVTAAVPSFVLALHEKINDEEFLTQVSSIGLLVIFESLLDLHGKEAAMLDDEIVAVKDLSGVKIRLMSSKQTDYGVEGPRYDYTIKVPVEGGIFDQLPEELVEKEITIKAVLFNIGKTKSESKARKILKVNQEALKACVEYGKEYSSLMPKDTHIDNILQNLNRHLTEGHSQNGQLLLEASEFCRAVKGISIVNCASGIDRTSKQTVHDMARTLMQNHSLSQEEAPVVIESLLRNGVRKVNAEKNKWKLSEEWKKETKKR